MRSDLSRQGEVAGRAEMQEMARVGLEAIVGALPEVSVGVGQDAQDAPGRIDGPVARLAMPA